MCAQYDDLEMGRRGLSESFLFSGVCTGVICLGYRSSNIYT